MANPTIKNSNNVTFTFTAGEVRGVRSQTNADIEPTPFPGTGPANALNFDFNGPIKRININGVLFDDGTNHLDAGSAITILEQKQWLENNISGLQDGLTFASTYETQSFDGSSLTNTKVFVGNIAFDEQAGNPEQLPFTISFLVGGF